MANLGLYHPSYNKGGAAKASDDKFWHNTSVSFTSTADCFNPTKLLANSGTIASGKSGRDDGKYADAIYASDFIGDGRILLGKSLERAHAGKKKQVLRSEALGYEVLPICESYVGFNTFDGTGGTSTVAGKTMRYGYMTLVGDALTQELRVKVGQTTAADVPKKNYIVVDGGVYVIRAFLAGSAASNTFIYYENLDGSLAPLFDANSQIDLIAHTETSNIYVGQGGTWTDIIGSPTQIKAMMDNLGWDYIYGQWIPVIPDGTTKDYPATHKFSGTQSDLVFTVNNGGVWGTATYAINTTTNVMTQTPSAEVVGFKSYSAALSFLEGAINSRVDYSEKEVFASSHNDPVFGGTLNYSLTGKIPTGSSGSRHLLSLPLGEFTRSSTGAFLSAGSYPVTHETIDLVGDDSPAAKSVMYETLDGKVPKSHWLFKELVWDSAPTSTDILVNTATNYVAGDWYRFRHPDFGGFEGYLVKSVSAWNGISADTISTGLYLVGNKLAEINGTVRFELWNGNGFGDNNQFIVANNTNSGIDDNGNAILYGTKSEKFGSLLNFITKDA